MNIKRICAANVREAMRKVRDELGPDAVILSNRRVGDGVEVMAASEYDQKLLWDIPQSGAQTPSKAPAPEIRPDAVKAPPVTENGKPQVVWSQDPLLVTMQDEIKVLRSLLEQQLSGLAWGDMARRQPRRADLLKRLTDFGLGYDLCLRLAEAAAGESDLDRAWNLALSTLAQGLSATDDDILTQGGVVALVGPTGVGKTTTVAKLAARYILRYGPGRVGLITTDGYRIGAVDQLRTFGLIMDAPVCLADSPQELRAAVAGFADKSLILIDTAGMSQRDLRLSQQFALFEGVLEIRTYLVMAANAQAHALQEAANAFRKIPLAGCILTKLDETNRLGDALATIHEQQLPLAYISDGQRVPEDLRAAKVDTLVRFAAELAEVHGSRVEDESLALTFGRRMANAGL